MIRLTLTGIVTGAVAAALLGAAPAAAEPAADTRATSAAMPAVAPAALLRPRITLAVTPTVVDLGARVQAVGRVTPALRGGLVYLQRRSGSGYVIVGRGLQNSRGAFRIVFTANAGGARGYRVVTPAVRGRRAVGISPVRTLTTHRSSWLATLSSVASRNMYRDELANVSGLGLPHSIVSDGSSGSRIASMEFDLGRAWVSLSTQIGFRDDSDSAAVGWLDVFADGRRITRRQFRFGERIPLSLNVTGVSRVRFVASTVRTTIYSRVVIGSPRLSTRPNGAALAAEAPFTYLADVTRVAGDYIYTGVDSAAGVTLPVMTYLDDDNYSYDSGTGRRSEAWEFDLGRSRSRLVASVSLLSRSATSQPRTVAFYGDGRLLATVTATLGAAAPVDINVSGVLRLRVEAWYTATSWRTAYVSFGEAYVTP